MGGSGASLDAALTYSGVVFAGAILVWLFNSLANVIRGTGNMVVPALVTVIGVAVLIPLSPCLIFGLGPLPRLGVAGGAVAVLIYYAIGSVALAAYLRSGRSIVRLSLFGIRLRWPLFADILRVGAVAALITVQTNLTIAIATGLVGAFGPAAIAGYGTGSRLEYLLDPAGVRSRRPAGRHGRHQYRRRPPRSRPARGLDRRRHRGRAVRADRAQRRRVSGRLAVAVRHRAGDARCRRALSAYGRPGLWPVRARHGALFCLARRRAACCGRSSPTWRASSSPRSAAIWRCALPAISPTVFIALSVALATFGLINAAAVAGGAWFAREPVKK